jgi:hypothetical protein
MARRRLAQRRTSLGASKRNETIELPPRVMASARRDTSRIVWKFDVERPTFVLSSFELLVEFPLS